MRTAYDRVENSWGVGGLIDNPTAPHMGTARSRITYADGHVAELTDDYTGVAFPFIWE